MKPARIATIGDRSVLTEPAVGRAIVSHGHWVGGGGGGGTTATARRFVTVTPTTPPLGMTVVKLVPPGSEGLYTTPVHNALHVVPLLPEPLVKTHVGRWWYFPARGVAH